MLRLTIAICALLVPLSSAAAQRSPSREAVRVEVVATASEYVPRSTTVSHPGHAYTDCLGSTSYFGRFRSYGDSGSLSGTAETSTHCSTTFTSPTETTLTTYLRINYTIARGEHSLYLLACTQRWKRTGAQLAAGVIGAIAAGGAGNQREPTKGRGETAGTWSKCPAFGIGGQYTLTVHNTSDARLDDAYGTKPIKLEYLSSAALPASEPPARSTAPLEPTAGAPMREARVHVTSSPSGGEIYVDGKFFGNTPSDITLATGEHLVKVTVGGKEWSRAVQITAGEIHVHADISEK